MPNFFANSASIVNPFVVIFGRMFLLLAYSANSIISGYNVGSPPPNDTDNTNNAARLSIIRYALFKSISTFASLFMVL